MLGDVMPSPSFPALPVERNGNWSCQLVCMYPIMQTDLSARHCGVGPVENPVVF